MSFTSVFSDPNDADATWTNHVLYLVSYPLRQNRERALTVPQRVPGVPDLTESGRDWDGHSR
jgi:hypothetical protein